MRAFLHFYKRIQSFNISFSLAMSILGLGVGLEFWHTVFTTWLTAGFLLSIFFFEFLRKNEYYFYFNKGLSRLKLFGYSALTNIAFCVLIVNANNLLILFFYE
ncbi:MAG: hypothetical protein JXQ96_12805 [Cyclobacteriaceae bacterium]